MVFSRIFDGFNLRKTGDIKSKFVLFMGTINK